MALTPIERAEQARLIDLMPVPAAVIERNDDDLTIPISNRAFRQSGLLTGAEQGSLVPSIDEGIRRFLDASDLTASIAWQSGESIDCRHYSVMLARQGAVEIPARCLVTLLDHTAVLRTEKSMRREMMTDSLTGLLNRAGFGDLLDEQCAGEGQARFAVLAVNLDRFSRINACMGGIVGDELLISVARRLKGALRARDTLARTGGDEFAILMRLDEGPVEAEQVARRIENALATPFRLSDFDIRVDCSIGIAFGADAGDETENLIRHAQFAVKASKKSGRVEVYTIRAFDAARTQFGIETELRRAIDQDALMMAYQPICDLSSGRVVAFEALARWTREDGTVVSPTEFIPVAEESGLIVPLGRWAMETALTTLAGWDAASSGHCGVNIAVNLSALQLHRDRVAPMVELLLAATGMTGDRLTVELTESAIIADPDGAADALSALKALGATIAMDDFGTGYSNLAYLQTLPIDVLKIDRSFVSDMLNDRDKIAIVRAILSLAQALGMRTTAEGIETRELEQTLAALGCTQGQGYFYTPAVAADQAYQFLLDRNH